MITICKNRTHSFMISQCPPLLGPTRRITSISWRRFTCFFTPLFAFFVWAAISAIEMEGLAMIRFTICSSEKDSSGYVFVPPIVPLFIPPSVLPFVPLCWLTPWSSDKGSPNLKVTTTKCSEISYISLGYLRKIRWIWSALEFLLSREGWQVRVWLFNRGKPHGHTR